MTALVKGFVTQGHAPPPLEAHVIKYAKGGAIAFYVQNFSCYFSELGLIFKKALHLIPSNSHLPLMPVWRDKMKPSSNQFVTDTQKK